MPGHDLPDRGRACPLAIPHSRAPFAPGGDTPVDAATCERLLGVALSRGGEYADLFFEYRAAGGFSYEEGLLKAASRGVSVGVGVRVQRGDATGYAYTEDLTWPSMKRAAETAAQIATGNAGVAPVAVTPRALPRRYDLPTLSLDVAGLDKRALLERASRAAHAYAPEIIKCEASFAEEVREILIATSDGALVHDLQPLLRIGVRAVAERAGKRQEGSSGGGGRMTMGYFDDHSPSTTAARPPARPSPCSTRARPRPVKWRSSSRRATAEFSCTKPSVTGSRPTSTAKARATTRAKSARTSPRASAPSSTTPRYSRPAAPSTSTTRATSLSAAS